MVISSKGGIFSTVLKNMPSQHIHSPLRRILSASACTAHKQWRSIETVAQVHRDNGVQKLRIKGIWQQNVSFFSQHNVQSIRKNTWGTKSSKGHQKGLRRRQKNEKMFLESVIFIMDARNFSGIAPNYIIGHHYNTLLVCSKQ